MRMTLMRVAGLVAGIFITGAAEAYPTKPVRLVIPFEAGGFTDLSGRNVASAIQETGALPQPVVPVNVTGAGGVTGARMVFEAEPDGYTMLIMSIALLGGQARGVTEFGADGFEPVAIVGESCYTIMVNNNAPWVTLTELMEDAAARPGAINYGVPIGAAGHMAALFLELAHPGAKFNVVNSGGSGRSIPRLMGGHIDVHTATVATLKNTGDQVRALAILGTERSEAVPDLPTAFEQGIDAELCLQNGFYMPRGTPPEVVSTMADALEKASESDAFRRHYTDGSMTFRFMREEAMATQLEADKRKVDAVAVYLRGEQ